MKQKDLLDRFFNGAGMGRSSQLTIARMENGARALLSYEEPIAVQSQVSSGLFRIVDHDYSPRTNRHINQAVIAAHFAGVRTERITRYEARDFAGLDPDVPCKVRRDGHSTYRSYCTENGSAGSHVPLGEVA